MAAIDIPSITFEHHSTGFGVGHATPRISWRFVAAVDTKGWMQESYEIHVSRPGDPTGKTYQVQSAESVLVPWPDQALKAREIAYVQVRAHGKATDQSGAVTATSTEWSSPATVEAALLDKGNWTAKLTTSTINPGRGNPIPPVLFRKVFSIADQPVAKARLYITAQGLYEAFINGQRVGQDEMAPGWTSYKHRLLYSTFDVTASLNTGKSNVFAVEVGEGWFAGQVGFAGNRHLYGDRLAFLAQLEVSLENGEMYTVTSDGTWKSHKSATTRAEIYNGEDHDTREEQPGWNRDPEFDDQSWTSTEELDFPSANVIASDMPPVRVKDSVAPVKIFKSRSGKTLVDFGQNVVGKLRVQLPPWAGEGHTVSFSHAEVLEHDELGTRPLREAKPIDHVVLSDKQLSTWSPKFTFHGFRYVQINDWPSETQMPTADDITALVMHSDMKRTGWFSSSDPMINRLHENVIWSMKGNFLSLPTDCPQRQERLGWTGDIQVFTPSASFLFDTQGFLGSWLQDLAAEQLEDNKNGIPPLVVPDIRTEMLDSLGPQAVWHDVSVLTPWDLYNSSGDTAVLSRQYTSMKAWIDQGIKRGPNGLWDQNIWHFADWLDPAAPPNEPGLARTDNVLVADAYLVRVLDVMADITSLLGKKDESEHYRQSAASTRKAFQDEYITPSGLLVSDTQCGHALALCFQLFANQAQIAKSARRLAHLVHQDKYRIATGFAGTPLISHALSDTGNLQLAYRMLLEQKCPSWLYPITMGATTIWERWDSMLPDGTINPGNMTSFNHYALGSVANWLHKNVGGISPLTPGWQKVLVAPRPGGTITSAEVAYESPFGRIECSWKLNDAKDTFEMSVTIPPNSKAMVVLPSQDEQMGQGGGNKEAGREIGSGKHQFSCAYKAAEYPPKAEFKRSAFFLDV